MTLETLIPAMRALIQNRNTGRLNAIRLAREHGFTFKTARTMADEITADAHWYRPALYPAPRKRSGW